MEYKPAPSQEEFAQQQKFKAVVEVPTPKAWPSWANVVERYPSLCEEEQQWVLEAEQDAANLERQNRDQANY